MSQIYAVYKVSAALTAGDSGTGSLQINVLIHRDEFSWLVCAESSTNGLLVEPVVKGMPFPKDWGWALL